MVEQEVSAERKTSTMKNPQWEEGDLVQIVGGTYKGYRGVVTGVTRMFLKIRHEKTLFEARSSKAFCRLVEDTQEKGTAPPDDDTLMLVEAVARIVRREKSKERRELMMHTFQNIVFFDKS